MNAAGNKPQTRDKFIAASFKWMITSHPKMRKPSCAVAFQKDFCLVISELIGVVLKFNLYSEG